MCLGVVSIVTLAWSRTRVIHHCTRAGKILHFQARISMQGGLQYRSS